jgi:hypothetical protein
VYSLLLHSVFIVSDPTLILRYGPLHRSEIEMNLPFINVFEEPYEAWESRQLGHDEILNNLQATGKLELSGKSKLIARITNHRDAAIYMLQHGADNGLEFHINQHLRNSPSFREMLSRMPSNVPASIEEYKNSYPAYNIQRVSNDIENFGQKLHEGQALFHGGFCPNESGEIMIIDRPFSTSFCPQVALRNAEWRGKAYEVGEVHLFVLRVISPTVKAYVFSLEGDLGNEKEILFSSGAKLEVISKTLIRSDYCVCKVDDRSNTIKKRVPAYVMEFNIT